MRKKWGELSTEEVNKIKAYQCLNCVWFSTGTAGYKASSTCEYGSRHDHPRMCDPRDCIKKGIFVEKVEKKKKRSNAWKAKVKS